MGFVSELTFQKKRIAQLSVTTMLCVIASVLMPQAAVAIETHERVLDLRYGVSLYHYYVGEYPEALTTLMLAESEGGIKGHKDYPEVMNAGIRLAFGMRSSAQQKFDYLLTEEKPEIVRDTANYYLTKIHYLQSDYLAAGLSANAVGNTLNKTLQDDLTLLRIHMAIKARDKSAVVKGEAISAEMAALLENLDSGRILALYNLGNAAARANNNLLARVYYEAAIASPYPKTKVDRLEYLAIRDKVFTALGFIYLREEKYTEALNTFPNVRLKGGQENQALLGYGWAAVRDNNYLLALKPWQALRKGSLLDASVQESLLALPWAYEQLNEVDAARAAYRESEALLTEEYEHVETLVGTLDHKQLIAAIQSHDAVEGNALIASPSEHSRQNWLTLGARDVAKTSSSYLERLFNSNVFQVDTQQLRDLLELKEELVVWENKLDVYRQLLLDKQVWRNEREVLIEKTHFLNQYKFLSEDHERLAEQLRNIKESNNYLALASAETKALNSRVERSIKNIHALMQEKEKGNSSIRIPFEAEEKVRFFSGVLQGRAAQAFSDNVWALENQLNKAKQGISISETSSPRIARLLEMNLDINTDLSRIAALRTKTVAEIEGIDEIINQQGLHVNRQITLQLEAHKTRLQSYLAQTRLSLAQLYDNAYRKSLDVIGPEISKPEAGSDTEALQ